MIRTAVLGFPRIGPDRELKRLVEKHWQGELSAEGLLAATHELRRASRSRLVDVGVSEVPSGDFSLYDHVLDLAQAVGAVPTLAEGTPLDDYFLLARGRAPGGRVGRALEMTKWFDTNYHYLVPEIAPETRLALRFNPIRQAYQEALAEGRKTRPVVLGPVSFLQLSKDPTGQASPLARLADLLPVYA
ncbi:MAG TPA: hypothetical protein VLC09_09115, partial [Polyangiaceae bacterium]|nr:hypothetical protein [Polyangiaceae bacterium]